ncbi:MAG: nitrate reductase cytochrome c-type subunit [Helicobacteraceae bacterium]
MKNKFFYVFAVAVLAVFASCSRGISEESFIKDDELGLRKAGLDDDENLSLARLEYSKSEPSSGYKIDRSFQDAPPLIPHDTEGMFPITAQNNQCIECHMPEIAKEINATPIPASHFIDFRPKMKYAHKKYENSVRENQVVMNERAELSSTRFNCNQCHVPQAVTKPLVPNEFAPQFSSQDGAHKSNLNGKTITDGVNMKTLSPADFKNANSPAGKLDLEH